MLIFTRLIALLMDWKIFKKLFTFVLDVHFIRCAHNEEEFELNTFFPNKEHVFF